MIRISTPGARPEQLEITGNKKLGQVRLLACLALAGSWVSAGPLVAAVAPPLGSASGYAVLGTNSNPTSGTVTCTNTGPGGTINGNVGTTGGSITNTGPCNITGSIDAPVAGTVVADFNAAYAALDNLNPTCDGVVPTTSTALPPGVYCAPAEVSLGAGVIFTLNGDAADVWVFKIGTSGSGALTGNSFQVVMGGSANACNVYWRTAEAATMTDSSFIGTILAGTAVTMTRGSYLGRAFATTDATLTDPAPMTFAGCAAPASITVNKDFIPNSVAPVSVALTCTSGTATTSPLNASEATPAVFEVGGASPGTTCTATETVPVGYSADQTNCQTVPLGGSCTITNTINGNTITVNKNFLPDSLATVSVALTCTSGTVTNTPLEVSEGAPAVFTVEGANPGVTCTATEAVPANYAADQTSCLNVPLGGSCTIVNTLAVAIPTLSTWTMIILAALLAFAGFAAMRKPAAV